MQRPLPPEEQSPGNPAKAESRASLALRLDRAAGELNPFLMLVMVGLLVLDLTVFLGLAASRQPFMHAPAGQQTEMVPARAPGT